MAGTIDEAQVRKVAKLARLELTDEEVKRFSRDLAAILEYIQKLNELNTDGVEPLAHCLPITNVLRDDIVRPSLGAEATLANAPDRYEDYFKVPSIFDDNSGA
ncbi:MAG: Asp-tRNA(Asn)/Glu-tRNA(Gln) amidotransferase subunit GatC [Phycisphaerae bacterium]|nr:Asp-tRNA(Asn)/Glu-tRNA(Gln) amidotransferase subunit GatC [Phycisphaerae bacterium]